MLFHSVGIRLSGKHSLYSLESVFEMVPSSVFNVSMFIWPLPVAVPFVVSRNAASISHDVIVWVSVDYCTLLTVV